MQLKRMCAASSALVFVGLLSTPAISARQSNSAEHPLGQTGQTNGDLHMPQDKSGMDQSTHERFEEQAAKSRNSERFKRIQSDTEKLLQLSTELKADVDKSTKNELSLDVIRKAAEVEKLAHDVRERMKG